MFDVVCQVGCALAAVRLDVKRHVDVVRHHDVHQIVHVTVRCAVAAPPAQIDRADS
jgi:hypothetical protein